MTDIMKHTPGPWRIDASYEIPHVIASGFEKGATCVAVVYGDNASIMARVPGSRIADVIPNAHLLAAAPDMLAVLRDLEWSRLNDGCGVTRVQCPACFALQSRGTGHNPYCGLAAAIAKAEGR